jgi:D-tagatose-1,6-bisphosphate aldolase subunit GatZ/KbaZ
MYKSLQEFGSERLQGHTPGIYSVCSSHPWVIEAAMRHALQTAGPLLIEATCNQVNQFGGYTGLTPSDFRQLVSEIADRVGFPIDRLILGGDHLGPYPWQAFPATEAMKHATNMVKCFVASGFSKIHLDTSMPCAGDPTPLSDEIISERAAVLASAAESCTVQYKPVYVIGTEVPAPGGAVEALASIVTHPADAEQALATHELAFRAAGLSDAWGRVIALVVQPGVEYGHEDVLDYDPQKAASLSGFLRDHSSLVFEAHSTDFQRPMAYRELVRDGFAILKVGPALTYAMREAIFALERIEEESVPAAQRSHLLSTLEEAMLRDPSYWKNHYQGPSAKQRRILFYSYSDRLRYYWPDASVRASLQTLIRNLEQQPISPTLLSEFLSNQYRKVRAGRLENKPLALIFDKIAEELEPYQAACSCA